MSLSPLNSSASSIQEPRSYSPLTILHSTTIFDRAPSPSSFEVVKSTFFTDSQANSNFSLSSKSISVESNSSPTAAGREVKSQSLASRQSSILLPFSAVSNPNNLSSSNLLPTSSFSLSKINSAISSGRSSSLSSESAKIKAVLKPKIDMGVSLSARDHKHESPTLSFTKAFVKVQIATIVTLRFVFKMFNLI